MIAKYEPSYPSAMASLKQDLTASLTHLKLPARLRQVVRTTNLLERTFEEERRRTKIIPRFFNEKSCLKLVYAYSGERVSTGRGYDSMRLNWSS